MANSNVARSQAKARKKKPERPPFKHQSGRWAKKHKGKFVYLGKVADDPHGERAILLWADYKAGRPITITPTGAPTVADVVNGFLEHTESLVETGERSRRTLADYLLVGQRMADVLGRDTPVASLTPTNFARLRSDFAKTRGAFALSGDVARVRAMFNWGTVQEIITALPSYGASFKKPNLTALRLAKAKGGEMMFERHQLWAMLYGDAIDGKAVAGASQPLRSMILLAMNAGLGNADIGRMPLTSVNFKTGWLDLPRVKTGIGRRVPLWPETLESLQDWLTVRPRGADAETDRLLFVTSRGGSWFKEVDDSPIAKETSKLLKRLGIHRKGLAFYSLRRTFRTIASETHDEAAADAIMGHAPNANDMASIYRQRVADDRLQAVVDYVRGWLFPRPIVG